MSRQIGPHIGPFLQHKIHEWLRADATRRPAEMARRSGISESLISRIRNHGRGAGWEACTAIGRVLGYETVGDLERDARAWWIENGHDDPSVPTPRAEHPLLRDRSEWADVARAATEDRPEIDLSYIEQVGQVYDCDAFPRPLSVKFVGNLAYVLFVEGRRRPR